MKVLYDWLKEFTDIKLGPAELRDRLSLTGTAVEGLEDTPAGPMLDAELTINRPDCLGHYGMAREVATLGRNMLRPIEVTLSEAAEAVAGVTRVDIECPELCGRYTARILRGVRVQPSPDWLRQRLAALGQNSVNNIADATNYVMLELGQPMHAFDFDKLAEHRIVVRRSRASEKIRTLDDVERTLPQGTCVIADASRPVAIAGIMGGAESGIGSATRNVLLESAWFEPIALRRTSKALNLRSEASLRFERGADLEVAELASRRCAALIRQLAGGEILAGVIDVYPGRRAPRRIQLSRQELLRVLGADVPDAEIESILSTLGFAPRRVDTATDAPHSPQAVWECVQPSWRDDVSREIDLIEEVARHFGFEKFPPRLHAAKRPAARLPHAEAEDRLRERLIGLGYHEIVTIPLVNEAEDALFRAPGPTPARVGNPLAADVSLLRSNGLLSMVNALSWNLNRGQRNVRLFEIGRAYGMKRGAPVEMRILTLGATGAAREKGVFETPREYVFADLKGDLDQLGELAGGFFWHPNSNGPLPWQHPARSGDFAIVEAPDLDAGVAGQLSQRVADQFKLRQDAFLAEFPLDPFYHAFRTAKAKRQYHPISRFPAVERDFSLILDEGVTFAAIFKTIEALGIDELIAVDVVDLYRGKNLPAGKFSLLVRVTFQSSEATLNEAQLNEFSSAVLAALERQLGATLRGPA
jgi:phenylalanyl-tRNA synthetase beta chain